MKRKYVGHVVLTNKETGEKNYRIFLLKQSQYGTGLEPVVKYSRTGKMYFPVVNELPAGLELGKDIDVICDENGNIVSIK